MSCTVDVDEHCPNERMLRFEIFNPGGDERSDTQVQKYEAFMDRVNMSDDDLDTEQKAHHDSKGIGKSLIKCRRVVKLMRGIMEFLPYNRDKHEFAFRLKIPLVECALPQGKTVIAPCQPRYILQGVNALVVDDIMINSKLAQRMLQFYGANAAISNSSLHAYDLTQGYEFDLIIMDIHMPDMDGIELTEKILSRCRNNCKREPVIIGLTSGYSTALREHARAVGFCELLMKPARKEHMINTILNHYKGLHDHNIK
jgi:CheY-like chemotaxis protein